MSTSGTGATMANQFPLLKTEVKAQSAPALASADAKMSLDCLDAYYGKRLAVDKVTMPFREKLITAIIGPSGCGKTTLLRTLNRMNDSIPGFRVEGKVLLDGNDIYHSKTDVIGLRRRVGMVFQQALRHAALWDVGQDRLQKSAMMLSGGEQQRLCIARALAVQPEVLLMDEPASALDPISTAKIEELMVELKKDYTIVIVTHNMQQAARVSDFTAFLLNGHLIECCPTPQLFTTPGDPRTEAYITGRFG